MREECGIYSVEIDAVGKRRGAHRARSGAERMDLPLGVVTSVNGSVRSVGEIIGVASHAGTTPMNRRRDAAAAAGELLLAVEQRGSAVPDLVATVGMARST